MTRNWMFKIWIYYLQEFKVLNHHSLNTVLGSDYYTQVAFHYLSILFSLIYRNLTSRKINCFFFFDVKSIVESVERLENDSQCILHFKNIQFFSYLVYLTRSNYIYKPIWYQIFLLRSLKKKNWHQIIYIKKKKLIKECNVINYKLILLDKWLWKKWVLNFLYCCISWLYISCYCCPWSLFLSFFFIAS